MRAIATTALVLLAVSTVSTQARGDDRQEACKKAMNDRIQVCTDDCTSRALAAASEYVDTNHNVKFGCLKGCAIGQVMQMKACREGKSTGDVETNR